MLNIVVKEGKKFVGVSAFISFPYSDYYVNLMRGQPKRYWHADDKCWEVPYENLDLVLEKVNNTDYKLTINTSVQKEIDEQQEIQIPKSYKFKTEPFQHQVEGVKYGLNHKKFLLADEQGCIDGDMLVSFSVSGATKTEKLSELYRKYKKSSVKEKYKVRCLKDGVFGLNNVQDIVYSGKKPVYKVTLENGKSVNATEDHEILTTLGFIPLNQLTTEHYVITNGDILHCPCCGTTENLVTYKYAKFYGYCKDCMYLNRNGTKYKGDEIGKHIGNDGYVYMFGKPLRTHPRYTASGLLEHVFVMEQHIGRPLNPDEQVHYKNGIRHDNRIENLQLVTCAEHLKIHQCEKHLQKDFVHSSGSTVIVIPKQSKVVCVEYVGVKDTYDIKMDDPYRNFVANKVVVHNCGKTKQIIDIACIRKQFDGYKHCLIIACVNGLKYNWQEEILTHSDETGYILGTRVSKKGKTTIGSNKDRLYDLQHLDDIKSYFIITNIETLRYTYTEKVPCQKKGKGGVTRYKKITKFPIVEELQKLIRKKEISMIVADEVHKCFSGDTKVLTDKGLVPIVDIVHNRCYKVATKCDDGTIEFVTPTNYWINPKPNKMLVINIVHAYKNEFFDIVTKKEQIICTPEHEFLMNDGTYKEAQKISLYEPLFNGYFENVVEVSSNNCIYGDYVYDLEIPNTHNYIIYDNIIVHNCKDSTSLQGKALLSLDADSIVALTGTPLMNNAIDLYTPLKFIDVENHSLFAFKNHYCICGGFGGHQIVGYKNLPELQTILDKCMLRRLKKEVLDLPEKIYINDFVEMNQSQYKIYNSILEDLRQNIDKVKLSPNPLTMLIRLRQATGNPEMLSTTAKGNPKFERLLELIQEVVDNGNKAIVFSNWTDVLNPAFNMLQKNGFNPALYTGLNKDTREDEKRRFKTDDKCKVICGTIGAMGTGLTLTEATTVIFLDEPWNRAIKDQAEDRAHRIGTTSSLNVITIMCKDSIDEKIHNIVYRKGKMSDIIVDKEEDLFKNPSVINYLLS